MQLEQVYQDVQPIRDALKNTGNVDVLADWRQLLQRWRICGQALSRSQIPGLPPSFSRKHNSQRDPAQLAAMILGNCQWKGIKTWRRKLLNFPSESSRPAFYGSFSRKTVYFGPRRVIRKDPDLDYDVMSDEDWEEEPEGEDICGNDVDADDDEALPEDEDDGFFVAGAPLLRD